METSYTPGWVDAEVARTIAQWNQCALPWLPAGVRYSAKEHRAHEQAYDQGLRAVQREARRAPRTRAQRLAAQRRIVRLFPGFASVALGLDDCQNQLITGSFLPVATELARWTREFDPAMATGDIIQACRNAWSCCGLQALLGLRMELTPSILAYSLLYPYTDNYLDQRGLSTASKIEFSRRFHQRLVGQHPAARNPHEARVWSMVKLIEGQYPRSHYAHVFDALLAIHHAQEQSMAQLNAGKQFDNSGDNSLNPALTDSELMRITFSKGGTSVLADACLAQPWLSPEETSFAFDWGVLLQLGDDLQDVREDQRRSSITLFTRAVAQGKRLDPLIAQLLHFSRQIADRMDRMPNGSTSMKGLLRMSWRSLILMAVADVQAYCSPSFLAELEPCSSFRFNFLRERNPNLASRAAFHDLLFDAFIEAGPGTAGRLPMPKRSLSLACVDENTDGVMLANSFA